MLRFPSSIVAIVMTGSALMAQADLKSRLMPVTAPVKNAGVYHVATGKWTRGAVLANGTGPSVIYNNSCATVYFTSMLSTERWQHRSRIPSPSGPTTDSIFYGTTDSAHRWDERPGCQTSYVVNGFEVEYCSSHIGTINWQYQFANNYTACGAADMIPGVTIAVTGLPGGTTTGQNCWIVGIDVSDENGGSNFSLSADGDGTYSGTSTADQFGWSFNPTSVTTAADFTGPIIAGDYTWTGGPGTVSGVLTPCTGTDGTIWDSTFVGNGPTPAGELLGTGMSSSDFFRMAGGPVSAPSGPGCYYFGGNPHADFYLKLYTSSCCSTDCGADYTKFCAPGIGGIVTCPCGNPQVPAGSTTGCDNFVAPGGGMVTTGAGTAVTNSGDSLQFNITGGVGTSITVLFQGTTNVVNMRTGAGVRCVGGTLKRLYKGNPVGGAISFPNNGVKVHDQSAAKGFVINAPVTLFYYCAYRNSAANGQPGCPGLNFGFNSSNAVSVSWVP